MTKKESPGRDQRTGGDSHNANTFRARSEAAAMVAAAQARTRLVENALQDTLAHVLRPAPMSDEAHARIAGLLRQNGGDGNRARNTEGHKR